MSISIYQDYEHLLSGMPVLVHNILNIEAFCYYFLTHILHVNAMFLQNL